MFPEIGTNFFTPCKMLYSFWKECCSLWKSQQWPKIIKPPATPPEITFNKLAFQCTPNGPDVLISGKSSFGPTYKNLVKLILKMYLQKHLWISVMPQDLDSGYWVIEKCIIFPAKLTSGLLLSLIEADVDNLQRRTLKNGVREQVHLIPREKELKNEMLRKKIYRRLCSLKKGTARNEYKLSPLSKSRAFLENLL